MSTHPSLPRPVLATALAVLTAGTVLLPAGASAAPLLPRVVQSDQVPEALRTFYEQKPAWSACNGGAGFGFECTRVKVPLDYANPQGETIELAVNRLRATDPDHRIGSLVTNPGGPGGSGTEFVTASKDKFTDGLRARYDIVGFDIRGTGDSSPIVCQTDAEQAAMAQDMSAGTLQQQLIKDAQTKAARCQARAGALLPHVSSVEIARDVDVLRAVLGDAKLNYMGFSYGTYLGATYAELFPANVGRLVLDGAVDPKVGYGGKQAERNTAAAFDLAFTRFLADWSKQADYPLPKDPAAAKARIATFLTALETKPLAIEGSAYQLNRSSAVGAIELALYTKASWPTLQQALADALKGDGTALLSIALQGAGDSFTSDALTAISCLDNPETRTLEQIQADAQAVTRDYPILQGNAAHVDALSCLYWPARGTNTPHAISAKGAAPILVVGTTGDPATPYAEAQALAAQLESGRLLTYEGDGHAAYTQVGIGCISKAVDGYLLSDQLPAEGTSCTD